MPVPTDDQLYQILREEMEKAALKQAEAISLDLGTISQTFDAAATEVPRSTAILIAALIDAELTQYICRHIPAPNQITKKLFDTHGPLHTLANKIDLSYAFAWIGSETWKNLNLIRKIRNEFAHNPKLSAFDQEPVQSHLQQMTFDKALLEKMQFMGIIESSKKNAKTKYLVSSALAIHYFLRTVVVGPTSLQVVGGERVYKPKYDQMPATEKAVIDWCIGYLKKMDINSKLLNPSDA